MIWYGEIGQKIKDKTVREDIGENFVKTVDHRRVRNGHTKRPGVWQRMKNWWWGEGYREGVVLNVKKLLFLRLGHTFRRVAVLVVLEKGIQAILGYNRWKQESIRVQNAEKKTDVDDGETEASSESDALVDEVNVIVVHPGPSEEEELNESTENDETEEIQVRYNFRESNHGSGWQFWDVKDWSGVQENGRDFHKHCPVGVQEELLGKNGSRKYIDGGNMMEEKYTRRDWKLIVQNEIDTVVEKVSNWESDYLWVDVRVVMKWRREHQFSVVAEEGEEIESGDRRMNERSGQIEKTFPLDSLLPTQPTVVLNTCINGEPEHRVEDDGWKEDRIDESPVWRSLQFSTNSIWDSDICVVVDCE